MSDFGRAVARTGVPAKQIRPGRQMADDPSAFGPQAGFVVGSSVLDGQMVVLAERLGGQDPGSGWDYTDR